MPEAIFGHTGLGESQLMGATLHQTLVFQIQSPAVGKEAENEIHQHHGQLDDLVKKAATSARPPVGHRSSKERKSTLHTHSSGCIAASCCPSTPRLQANRCSSDRRPCHLKDLVLEWG